ncbi:Polyadenylate-binding protein 1 [Camellia lanceoleosa]|uniref:Polyadenylate-binding protein 1 n=1 Tax=Camellia lanceoleosa TaxID=1840588 RepID=A0ACC0FG38_9ERIC|nr:Polyadenylate-binding protein 1 [Camellia lanceoleosa]
MEVGSKNGANDHEWTIVSRQQRKPRIPSTVFIANIPEHLQVDSLKGIFQRFGRVIQASIPNRRTKLFNSRFGFIQYERSDSAVEAARKFNGAWYDEYNLIVKPARFERPPHPKHLQAEHKQRFQVYDSRHHIPLNLPRVQNHNKLSYAEVVKSNLQVKDHDKRIQVIEPPIKIHAKEVGDEWLYRSVVVKASLPHANQSILASFSSEDAKKI